MIHRLFSSTVFRFLERLIVVITSLLLTPFFINEIGTENYGLWLLILSIMGWFNVVDLGFPQAINRQVVQAIELKDTKRVNCVFSTGLVLFAVLGSISIIALLALLQVPSLFGVDGFAQITLVDVLLVLSLKIFWGFLMNPFHGIFSGLLRFDIDANLSSLNAIAKAVLVFLLIPTFNIWGAVAATLAADVVTNILKVIYAKRIFPGLSFQKNLVTFAEVKALFSYSKHLVLNGFINMIGSRSTPLIITHVFDLTSLAIHNIAGNLIMHGQAFISTITGVFSPVFNKMSAKKQNMEKLFIQTTLINLFATAILFSSLLAFGKVFILLWVGDEFEYAVIILYVATLPAIFTGITTSANQILLAQANHKLLSVISFFIVTVNIPLAIYLGHEFGLIGVVISTAVVNLIFNTGCKMALFKHYNNYPITSIYQRLVVTLIIVYTIGFSGAYIVDYYEINTWFELFITASISFPFIVGICWLLVLNKNLKSLFINLLMNKLFKKNGETKA